MKKKFIFCDKDMYLMSHNSAGRLYELERSSAKVKKKTIYENMQLLNELTYTNSGFPQMQPYTGRTDFTPVPYTEYKKNDGKNQALHFFLDDFRFRSAVWFNLERITRSFSKFEFIFTPDLSLWRDLPTEFPNKENIFRTRFIGAYWQSCGFNVIPTASWGGLNSFPYCFDGLPSDSILAVSGMGSHRNYDAFQRWCYGMSCLERTKAPKMILVYGREVSIPNFNTPLKFIPDYITTHLRNAG